MSKAEERAYEVYPKISRISEPHGVIPADNNSHYLGDGNEEKREGFIVGYHQAEKDIGDPIAWIKDVSGVKDMSRAKEEALKAYPPESIAANYDTINRRNAFEYGYLKAEKDLELTWEDIPEIFSISERLKTSWWFRDNEQTKLIGTQVFWEEVLKRFKERKEK